MTALNDLLNEDIESEHKDAVYGINDDAVTNHVEQFLTKLESFKTEYGINNSSSRIKEEIYEILKENEVSSFNDTIDEDKFHKSDEENAVLSANYFWRPEQSGRRVYRGERIKIKYFPFMASVQIFNQFYCGGSIIQSDLIVTASSCLQLAYNNRFFRENPAFLSVRVGSTFYNGGENIAVMEVYFHPEYNPKNLRNNICVLRLVRKINLKKKYVKKINFDRNASPLALTTDGITIIGWGAKKSSNLVMDPYHQQLSFAVLDMYPLQECQEVYSREYVTKRNFCAGFFSKGGGACNRDVGDPGVVDGVLMGVVSFGPPVCGTVDAPTVFTKIGYYTDWIEEIMEQDVPTARKRTTLLPIREPISYNEHTMRQTTSFRITPPSGPIKPIPISEVDALRMLQNSAVFQEFLETMFGSKEKVEYQDMLEQPVDNQMLRHEATEVATGIVETTTPASPMTLQFHESWMTSPSHDIGTPIGNFEPEDTNPTNIHDISTNSSNTYLKIGKDAELEKDLVELIDNMDLKEIIDNISSLENDKIVDETKLIELLGNKKVESKLSNANDTVLTLLYLSDSEKKHNEQNNEDAEMINEDNDNGEKYQLGDKGLSIETRPFQDMTLRNKNSSFLYRLLNEDLYGLMSDTINANADLNKK